MNTDLFNWKVVKESGALRIWTTSKSPGSNWLGWIFNISSSSLTIYKIVGLSFTSCDQHFSIRSVKRSGIPCFWAAGKAGLLPLVKYCLMHSTLHCPEVILSSQGNLHLVLDNAYIHVTMVKAYISLASSRGWQLHASGDMYGIVPTCPLLPRVSREVSPCSICFLASSESPIC